MKKKTLLTVMSVVFAFVIAFIAGWFLLKNVILPGMFGPSQIPEDEKIVEFDDGTILKRTGGLTYTHSLFDSYEFERRDTKFECCFYLDDYGYISDWGFVVRYAFDPQGYIAYRCLEKASYNGEKYLFEWDNYNITDDRTILYICETNTEIEFDSMNELYSYCEEYSIKLGEWYYPVGYTPMAEKIQLKSGNWTIASNTWNYCVVDNGIEELFSGYIDKYFVGDNYFGFHFQYIENGKYDIAENPVIKYSTDNVAGKKYSGLPFLYDDVYVDNYVLINTETDEYIVFDTKKELKQYSKEADLNVKWSRIEY